MKGPSATASSTSAARWSTPLPRPQPAPTSPTTTLTTSSRNAPDTRETGQASTCGPASGPGVLMRTGAHQDQRGPIPRRHRIRQRPECDNGHEWAWPGAGVVESCSCAGTQARHPDRAIWGTSRSPAGSRGAGRGGTARRTSRVPTDMRRPGQAEDACPGRFPSDVPLGAYRTLQRSSRLTRATIAEIDGPSRAGAIHHRQSPESRL